MSMAAATDLVGLSKQKAPELGPGPLIGGTGAARDTRLLSVPHVRIPGPRTRRILSVHYSIVWQPSLFRTY